MAVAFDATSPGTAGTGNTSGAVLSWTHTMGSISNPLIVVGVTAGGGSAGTISVTYRGTTLSSGTLVLSNNDPAGRCQLFWGTGFASGTGTVSVTCASSQALQSGAISFSGVDQSTPIGATATATLSGTGPSVVVSSAASDMVVDVVVCGSAVNTSTQTMRWHLNQNQATAGGNGGQSTAPGAASVTMAYSVTNDFYGMSAADLRAAAASALPPSNQRRPRTSRTSFQARSAGFYSR